MIEKQEPLIGNILTKKEKSGPLRRFFGFFTAIQNAFIQLGKIIGSKILFPIFGAIGAIMGIFEDIKGVDDGIERFIRGWFGAARGAFRILMGEFADFIKQAIGFIIDLIPGVDGVREVFGNSHLQISLTTYFL